jgi:LytS/YehU family sensor histidine kinase
MHSVWYKSYPYIAYGVIYVLIKIRINLSEQRDKSERSDLLSREAQLNLLRYQINPHFLFNVLNSIRALVKERKEDAEDMISELSEFMKFSLYTRNRREVPLIEELEMLDHYFRIEKIRFDENLVVKQDIDPLSEEFPVPPLILQPIIENAIKYGNQTAQPPLVIEINTRVEEQTLTIEISNTGKWVDERKKNSENGKRMGTGIENITSRLKFLYPDKHAFSIQKDNAKVTVHIEITKEFGKENYEEDESITR